MSSTQTRSPLSTGISSTAWDPQAMCNLAWDHQHTEPACRHLRSTLLMLMLTMAGRPACKRGTQLKRLQLWNTCALLLAMQLHRLTGIHSPLLTVRLRNASNCSTVLKPHEGSSIISAENAACALVKDGVIGASCTCDRLLLLR